jgi:3-methyladenine DNA glycosylase AlkD
MSLLELKKETQKLANPKKASLLSGFFKTGKGEYGEGDIFLGITVPESRKIAIKYRFLPLSDVESLLKSKIHEERLIALLLLVHNYKLASKINDEKLKEGLYNFYLSNTKYTNNWDLVDLSCHQIVGNYLLNKSRDILFKLSKSNNLWERRISIISTFAFIRDKDFSDSLELAETLLHDPHDLIHKAVGWMLREIGKKDLSVLKAFLQKHYKSMPRTMLRYAIEKFPETERKAYLKGEIL